MLSYSFWVLFATILASSMAFIDSSALNVALPAIQADLEATGIELLWIINAYLLLVASLMLVGGSLGDHFGRKRVFQTGIMVFTGASAVCGLAPGTGVLIAARAVQGIGGALMIPGSLAIIAALFPANRRGRAIGTWSAATTITTIGGPILGGALAEAGLWRLIFFINLPLGLLALVALFRYVPETRDETAAHDLDYPGALLAFLGLSGIVYGALEVGRQGPAAGFTDPVVVGSFLAGIAALIAFVYIENRSANPLVPLHLFRSRTFSGVNLMTVFLYAALTGTFFFLPLNLVQTQNYGETMAGFALIPFTVLLALLSRWAGGLADQYGPRLFLTVGPFMVGVGWLVLSLPGVTHGPETYWGTYFPGVLIVGLGMGLTVAPLTTTVMSTAPSSHSGVAAGISNAITRSSQVLATAIMGAVALVAFNAALDLRSETIEGLTGPQQAAIIAEARELGQASVPRRLCRG